MTHNISRNVYFGSVELVIPSDSTCLRVVKIGGDRLFIEGRVNLRSEDSKVLVAFLSGEFDNFEDDFRTPDPVWTDGDVILEASRGGSRQFVHTRHDGEWFRPDTSVRVTDKTMNACIGRSSQPNSYWTYTVLRQQAAK